MNELAKYVIFVIGGGIGLLINVISTYILSDVMGVWFRLAYAIGLAINLLFNFYYHKDITFRAKGGSGQQLSKFIPLTLAVTAANYILVLIFTEIIILQMFMPFFSDYYKYLIIIGVTGFVSVINYGANKAWVFK